MTTILNVISFLIKSKAIIPYLGVLIQQLYFNVLKQPIILNIILVI